MFHKDSFDQLVELVDYFSLMTYDYSNSQRPGECNSKTLIDNWLSFIIETLINYKRRCIAVTGPNSPVDWVKTCVENLDPESVHRNQILLGLNFYGNDYSINGGGPIVGSQYMDTLKSHSTVKFQWDDHSQEHFFDYKYNNNFFEILIIII